MARIRTIKPEFFRHEGLQDLEVANPGKYPMMVFSGLWGHCDKAGRFEWKPRLLKLDILPFIPFDMAETLTILEEAGFVRRYEIAGKSYGVIDSFSSHQRLGGKEAQEQEKHPAPPGENGGSTGEAPGKQLPALEGNGVGNGERESLVISENGNDEPESDFPPENQDPENLGIEEITEAVRLYNDMAQAMGLAKATKLTPGRRSAIRRRLQDSGGLPGWTAALVKLSKTPFCCGENSNGWRADLDFLCQQKSFLKLIEGGYDHGSPRQKVSQGVCPI